MSADSNVDVKLGVDKFFVDEDNPHIVLKDDADPSVFALLEKACPAGLYRRDDNGAMIYDYAGCLECGACRILGRDLVLRKWSYPNGGMGVEFRYG